MLFDKSIFQDRWPTISSHFYHGLWCVPIRHHFCFPFVGWWCHLLFASLSPFVGWFLVWFYWCKCSFSAFVWLQRSFHLIFCLLDKRLIFIQFDYFSGQIKGWMFMPNKDTICCKHCIKFKKNSKEKRFRLGSVDRNFSHKQVKISSWKACDDFLVLHHYANFLQPAMYCVWNKCEM